MLGFVVWFLPIQPMQPIQLLESSHASCCELSVAHLAMKPWPVLLFRLVGMDVSGVIAGAFE
jgi:hypothetical protein